MKSSDLPFTRPCIGEQLPAGPGKGQQGIFVKRLLHSSCVHVSLATWVLSPNPHQVVEVHGGSGQVVV
eukprot:scaffold8518_cov277-Pinguiococcus_pyrenoidosus.AAC.3